MLGRAEFTDRALPAAALSGGWKKRLSIAAALIAAPDVLLLDEPTNHLDLEGILWLKSAIQTAGACLVVTHDRYFLERVATHMLEINRDLSRERVPGEGQLQRVSRKARGFSRSSEKADRCTRHQSAPRDRVAAPRTESPHRQIARAYRFRRPAY